MKENALSRRAFMRNVLGYGALVTAGIPVIPCLCAAMGRRDYPQGMQTVVGDVRINGMPVAVGAPVRSGDVVTTGPPPAHAIFVMGRDAFLIRENTRIEVETLSDTAENKVAHVLRIVRGKMLSVFGKGNKYIVTPTAVAGIRGTGMYTEADPGITYICTCYGTTEIEARAVPGLKKRFRARHHEHPIYIYGAGNGDRVMIPAPMKNHRDSELILLASLVGRVPPFARKSPRTGNKY
ncbi:hypothetical protein DENIS_4540 [Desulfonema ishimotonii]|uniref:FecR protein domain-containing protein n=1 Tax=Desulfonema ishimotonii TaxID=45657 RepID=A0A401G2R6_9BACT|nr:hypothetical protein [Desulfonema ishimotonii]GBC63542.1 hypothetical protein DENIS_4540 [Desulfonema ishimotonii]